MKLTKKELIESNANGAWTSHIFGLSKVGILGSIVGELRWKEEAQYWFLVGYDGEVEYGRHLDCVYNYIPLIDNAVYNTYNGCLAFTFETPLRDLQIEVSYEYLEDVSKKTKLYRSIDAL